MNLKILFGKKTISLGELSFVSKALSLKLQVSIKNELGNK